MTRYPHAATLTTMPVSFADGADADTLLVTIGPVTLSVSRDELATILAGWGDNQHLVKTQIALALAGTFTPDALSTAGANEIARAMSHIVYPQ